MSPPPGKSDDPTPRAPPLRLVLALVAGFGTCAATCLLEEPDPDLHQWGRYQLCLEKRLDTCDPGDGGCPAVLRDETRSASFRVRKSTGVFELLRDGLDAGSGLQGGPRFEVVGAPVHVDAQCGCWMAATETVQGEFVTSSGWCGAADAGAACTTEEAAADAGWVPGVLAGFVDPDAPIDLDTLYVGVQGRVVVSLEPLPDAGTCTCGPCRIEYELRGRR